ncbi:hypothetical protein OWM54_04140 [Myxococcus sp. MISCRS1]|uniref:hypothetical protein n=1 Tax=Myxococcus TaxID=32 RepID=UPI001CBBFEBB|nr:MULTISPECIES: hypothetical protein [unclassified Myxococcus]MBZ4408561.1 hypothetical protein [Myxococcus sp. XM-1-1-1]MCY0996318.1 hypothetical protein [Myxococcus sp. MISCRS1]BDT33659.1 T9SS type A sorting domain-containing protein [Myxococcus sp. MH1]
MKLLRTALASLCLASLLTACGEPPPEDAPGSLDTSVQELPPLPDPGEEEPGGGGCGGCGGGSTPVTISTVQNTTPPVYINANIPLYPLAYGRPRDWCRQSSYVSMSYTSPLSPGGSLTFSGVVAPSTKVNFYIYDTLGNLVKTHQTHHSHDNCVIAHEQEVTHTYGLSAGTYLVYASYWFIGIYLNDGWYMNGGQGPLGYTNDYVGSFVIQ